MMLTALCIVACFLAIVPCVLYFTNIQLYRPAPATAIVLPAVSILIPARNEVAGIAAAVEAVRQTRGINWELIVLDDSSTDGTGEIVRAIADDRIRCVTGRELPADWCGKQHACLQLAEAAQHPLLVFLDADVRVEPEGLARLATFQRRTKASLVSGIPRQITSTFLERLLIPLIHFLLLGFLPIQRMRQFAHPAYGAGCGQLFLAEREAYWSIGGHAAVKASLHDGITLPRAFRAAGLMTDLCDATDLATCRMYHSARQVWQGLMKNACEGIGAPKAIVVWTVVLGLGQVAPIVLLIVATTTMQFVLTGTALGAIVLVRFDAATRFRQSPSGALLHPVGVFLLLVLQWWALVRKMVGKPAKWKGRKYQASASHF